MVGPMPVKPLSAKNNSVDDNLKKISTKPKVKKIKEQKPTTTSDSADKTTSSVVPEVEKEPMKETVLVKIDRKQIEEGVNAFTKLVELGLKDKKDLFASDGQKVNLQVSGIKLPKSSDCQVLKCSLPHSPLPASKDICLFVKDLEKGIKVDHEETVRHFTSMLEEKGVKGVTQVIALRELKVEYKQYEAKTQLVHRFDKFLADDRIIRLLPPMLGKAFYKRKVLPLQVNLKAKNLSAEFSKVVNTVTLPLKNSGSCASVLVGLTSMEQENLVENTAKLVQMLEDKYPGGWKNVRSVHLRCGQVSLPLYVCLRATQEVGMVHGAKRAGKGVVVDELSTVVGATVIVTPSGGVRVKRKKDPEWPEDDEELEKIVDSKEGDKENNDEPTEEGKDIEGKTKQGVKNKRQKKNEVNKKDGDAGEESEDELEDKELEYMQKVADEEEEIEKKIEATEEKQIEKLNKDVKGSDEESEEEDEDVIDDDAEAENLLSEGDESDSEEELIMKNKAPVDDEESEEEDKPRKKKKKVKKAQVEKTPSATKKSSKQRKFIEKKKKENTKSKK